MQMQTASRVIFKSFVFSSAIFFTAHGNWAGEASPQAGASASLLATIQRVSPGAAILRSDQVDERECFPSNSPGLVRADFNGDGLEDAAALLVTRALDKVTVWEGREFREAEFLLALFVNNGKGGYEVRKVNKFGDQIPTAVVLSLAPAGKIRSREKANETVLKNPAFVIHYCGKSSAAYTLIGNRLREILVSD